MIEFSYGARYASLSCLTELHFLCPESVICSPLVNFRELVAIILMITMMLYEDARTSLHAYVLSNAR
jgi:hypothetical protein